MEKHIIKVLISCRWIASRPLIQSCSSTNIKPSCVISIELNQAKMEASLSVGMLHRTQAEVTNVCSFLNELRLNLQILTFCSDGLQSFIRVIKQIKLPDLQAIDRSTTSEVNAFLKTNLRSKLLNILNYWINEKKHN